MLLLIFKLQILEEGSSFKMNNTEIKKSLNCFIEQHYIRPFFTPGLISKKIDNGYIIVINIKYTEVIQS